MEDIVGIAPCGCIYHAEEGIPCEHDIALAKQRGLLCDWQMGDCEESQDSKSVTSAWFAKELAGKCDWRQRINCSSSKEV